MVSGVTDGPISSRAARKCFWPIFSEAISSRSKGLRVVRRCRAWRHQAKRHRKRARAGWLERRRTRGRSGAPAARIRADKKIPGSGWGRPGGERRRLRFWFPRREFPAPTTSRRHLILNSDARYGSMCSNPNPCAPFPATFEFLWQRTRSQHHDC